MSSSVAEVKNIFEMTREELTEYNQQKYLEFKELYCTTNTPVDEIFNELKVNKGDPTYRYINGAKRQENLQRPENLIDEKLEPIYQEYKTYFNDTELSIPEIYEKLGIKRYGKPANYIRNRCKTDGLDGKARSWKIKPNRKPQPEVTSEELKRREEKYQEYRDLFFNSDLTLPQIYNKIHVDTKGPTYQHIKKRSQEEGLDGNERRKRLAQERMNSNEEYEKIYQDYKKQFLETSKSIIAINKELGITGNARIQRYINKRCKDEGLNGNTRRAKIKKENIGKAPLISYNRKNNTLAGLEWNENYSYFPKAAIKCVTDSSELIEKIFIERNIKKSTRKGYLSAIVRWFVYNEDKYENLQDCVNRYMAEEDDRVPMRDRSIKKDLIGYREFLVTDENIKTSTSLSSYFSKIGTIFRHLGLEIPTLPRMKLDKGYVSNYQDLPSHEMIRTACEQSPAIIKAIILFMSSSGTAKAETLSLTVEMFLKGCEEYLTNIVTDENIKECLDELDGRHDIVPLIYVRRLKTDKYYYTCCSPEAAYAIIEYLKTRHSIRLEDKLFLIKDSLLMTRFAEINDMNKWGYVGTYRRFRTHVLRKFHASNIGLPRSQVDSFQGRSKDMIQEAYFKQNPKELKDLYLTVMHRVMIYNNWGYGTKDETKKQAPVIANEVVTEPQTMEPETTPPVQSNSIAQELLMYSELLEKDLLTREEFDKIKEKLLTTLLQ